MAHTTENRPSGVGVLGLPTTTLIVRSGTPPRISVSVRLAVEITMRHRVFSRGTLPAFTQPAAALGRHGRRTGSQQRPSAARGRARTNSHGASDGVPQLEICRRLPGSRSNTAVEPPL